MQELQRCPICETTAFKHFITARDYTVSNKTFDIDQCASCGFVFTNPQPTEQELPGYYQSEAYISHSNKTTNIIDWVYKVVRKFTLRWKYNVILKHSLYQPKTILDYGCGTGAFLQQCQSGAMKATGVEPGDVARKHAQEIKGIIIEPTIDNIRESFDVITLWHVLEHVSDLNGTVHKLRTLLEENGTMFIAVPNHRSEDASEYKEHWAAYDVPRHLWHFTRETMTELLGKHSLKVVGILPMRLDAYYVNLLSEKYASGKNGVWNMTRALFRATTSNQKAKSTQEYSSLIYIVRK